MLRRAGYDVVIATSGYADDGVMSPDGWPADLVFLEKPFVLGELLQTVRAQLSD
ncbi:MAG: hypothetical protein IAG13_32225 [Deltaproteobacteria bacterium]|nr:hypothetical protein [Nannocystaceae bacterium]